MDSTMMLTLTDFREGRDYICENTDIAGENVLLPLFTTIRLAAGKPCSAPLIDFLCTSAGVALAEQGQDGDTAAGRMIVRGKVLTVALPLFAALGVVRWGSRGIEYDQTMGA
jgi:hypothetical protein